MGNLFAKKRILSYYIGNVAKFDVFHIEYAMTVLL